MNQPQDLIALLWQKSRPKILAHVDVLNRAANTSPLPDDLKTEALATAHKLAGSLGMYGYPAGTDLARRLEQQLELPSPDHATLQALTRALHHLLDQN